MSNNQSIVLILNGISYYYRLFIKLFERGLNALASKG